METTKRTGQPRQAVPHRPRSPQPIRTIREFMTVSPHTIAIERTLSDAHKLMREHGIRHLPVLEGGRLVGMVSQRDLHLLETLRDVNPAEIRVEEAMSQDVLEVDPAASLARVARVMGKRKLGSAVVTHGGEIVGIFSTVDALFALATIANGTAGAQPAENS